MSDLLPENPPTPENGYEVSSLMEMTPALFNSIFSSIHERLAAREELEADFEALIDEGTSAALTMIQENIAPQLVALKEDIEGSQEAIDEMLAGTAPNASKLGDQLPAYYLDPGNFSVSADIKALLQAEDAETACDELGVTQAISNAIDSLMNGAPGALDTLKELADALGNDADFATTVTNALAGKLALAGGTLTGKLTLKESAAGAAGFSLGGLGTAPTSPASGDVWMSSSTVSFRVGSTTLSLGATGNLPAATQAQAEAGTDTTLRAWSALRIAQAIAALSPISKFWESAAQTITAGGALTLAHTLGVKPKAVLYVLRCITAEHGYSVGDEIDLNASAMVQTNNGSRGVSSILNESNVVLRFGNDGNVFHGLDASSGATALLTNNRWRLIVRAIA